MAECREQQVSNDDQIAGDDGGNEQSTLVYAIKKKYCTAPEPYYDSDVLHSHREIKVITSSKRPGAIPVEDVKTIILESVGVSSVGSTSDLGSMCCNVTEVYLGANEIDSWQTVLSIVDSMPKLAYLDLNRNTTLSHAPIPPPPSSPLRTDSLSTLILSCSKVPFTHVTSVLQHLPSVVELHLSKNEYKDEDLQLTLPRLNGTEELPLPRPHPTLKIMHLVSNNITEWKSIDSAIGDMFPSLETLLVCHNPIDNITPCNDEQEMAQRFKQLKTLNLNNTNVSSWDSLESLQTFPSLDSLSLWHVPIGSELGDKEKRFSIISRLPSIKQLNKSNISETEREDSERWLIREYHKQSPVKRPSVYDQLTEKHGRLDPLPDIDLSPKTKLSLEFVFEDSDKRSEVHTVSTQQTVKEFKSWIGRSLLDGVHHSKFITIYVDLEEGKAYETTVMKPDSKYLYRFRMKDGDKIQVILK